MASEQERKTVVLKSNDGQIFEVEKKVAALSETINQLLEDDIGYEIPLPLIPGKVLVKIIEYCIKHAQIDNPNSDNGKADEDATKHAQIDPPNKKSKVKSSSKKAPLQDWDKDYINMDIPKFCEIDEAANYLNIKGLLDLTRVKIGDKIKDKSVEEVREIFQIENDFTPEEEEAIYNEYPWADE